MNSVSRRTRSQWDLFYRNCYNEVRGKTEESGRTSVEKQDIRINGGNTGGAESFEQDEGSGTKDVKRIRRKVSKTSRSGTTKETKTERMFKGDKDKNLDGVRTRVRRWKETNVRAATSADDAIGNGDDEVINLGEEVGSNALSSKVGSASRSRSGSKRGSVDEVVSCSSRPLESTSIETDQVKKTVVRGRGRPQIKHPNDGRHDDDSIDLENLLDSDDSAVKSDGSDTSGDSWLYRSDSSSNDDSSDEDYKGIASSSSDDSHVSYCRSDSERKEDDNEYGISVDGKSANDINADSGEENSLSYINKKTTSFGTKSLRMKGEKENDIEQVNDDDDNHCYNWDYDDDDDDDDSHIKINSDWKKMKDIIIILDDEEAPIVKKSTSMKSKKYAELTRINRTLKTCSKHINVDWAWKHRDSNGNSGPTSVSEQEDDNVIVTNSKKRKTSDLDFRLNKHNKDKHGSMAQHLQSCLISSSQKKKLEHEKLNCPVIELESDESASSADGESESSIREEGFLFKRMLKRSRGTKKEVKLAKDRIRLGRNLDVLKILENSIDALENVTLTEESVWTQIPLPLKFRFENEVLPLTEKSEREKEIDALFCDLEMGLRECEIGYPNSSETDNDGIISSEIDKSAAANCRRGEHHHILDEEIGIRCKYCEIVVLEIKYVLPTFYTPPLGARDRKEFSGSQSSILDQIHLQHPAYGNCDYAIRTKGTIWELLPGIENELYPHQREGLEFIWKNLAGDITIEKLKGPLSAGGSGCIISHAPGTGKTRLTIAFLLTFMKLYPTCQPVVIAPRSMLYTWEDELSKWQIGVPFHNMNKKELSDSENGIASNILGRVGGGGGVSSKHIRLAKLYCWKKRRSILGISYRLFEQLAGDEERGRQNGQIRRQLLESPGVLVLDEGHTARNSKSLMWKALTKVATQRRIMLTGTPFQNNFIELYNTLCLVNPKFANHFTSDETQRTMLRKRGKKTYDARSKFMDFTSTICKNTDEGLKKLRAMLDQFVHLYKGSILQESLPGLRNTLVFLHPTELQKTLFETATLERNIFHRIQLVSLISVHPSLVSESKEFSVHKNQLEEVEMTIEAGVKTKFVMNLISLADALGERVLIFSQFLDPLTFIRKQLVSYFSWHEGKEVLYMDGQSEVKHRQEKIYSFNDHSSNAKVLLASQRACSEGISLIGASRVVLIDTVWNPSVDRQAISRAFRLGQKRVVFVYRLMTSGTEFMQYSQQAEKDRMSQLIFSPVDEDTYNSEKSCAVWDDKVLDALVNLENFSHSFAKIFRQPKESDLIEILKSVDLR